jgi:SAM-dependent methyltransferase
VTPKATLRASPDGPGFTPGRRHWESAVEPLLGTSAGRLWRMHSDAVNGAIVERWLARETGGRALKTDLFDEAMGAGLHPVLRAHALDVVAIDIAPSVLSAAAKRYPALGVVAADVRGLPFADGVFDVVVSNATLDHFATRREILESLHGLHRVLKPGGRLVLTMDNLRHPGVALRNALPQVALRRIGLVDYPVGVTLGPRGLAALLREAHFEVLDTASILHCPRALAVRRARALERRGSDRVQARFLRRLARWEWLARLPTRYLTGHYVGFLARKA